MSTAPSRRRCAVYCRVSSDERLDQSFNSIDAQREAGQAFIVSQRAEGWIPVADDYDDGGYSGGNMERPALKRLLADIDAGRVDVVVVYKIDRLTRSLADFAKMVEVFERGGVSFVSVTQQFNTTTSMGRLMLNVLLSFAQFEREVTGERIRDKIAASKAKGLWMGGVPPLGYDVVDHTLVVNEDEAKRVRHIWRRFVTLRSPTALCRELARDGLLTKAWVTKTGVRREGRTITKQNLYKALRNPVYIGQIRHKGRLHPGQHEPIIDFPLWEAVQAILAEDEKQRASDTWARRAPPALLRGLLYSPAGDRMIPSFTRRRGKCYCYYIASANKRLGAGVDPVGSVPAAAIEAVVLEQVLAALRAPEMLQAVWDTVRQQTPDLDEPAVVLAMRNLSGLWGELFPAEQQRIVRLLIERVRLRADGIDIEWLPLGWASLAGELAPGSIGAEMLALEAAA